MFGAGYAGAQDRLFLMDVLRHVGRGQLTPFAGGAQGNREFEQQQWRTAPYTEADLQYQIDRLDDEFGAGWWLSEALMADAQGSFAIGEWADAVPGLIAGGQAAQATYIEAKRHKRAS